MDLAEIKKFESKVGVIKLSDAIRIGAKIRPQCKHRYYDAHGAGSTCAIGAAYEGVAGFVTNNLLDIQRVLPQLVHCSGECVSDLGGEITWRNDKDGWTREQIADWLEAQGL